MKTIYLFDQDTGLLLSSARHNSAYPMPPNAVDFAPPVLQGPQAAKINANCTVWDVVEDYRSSYVVDISNERVQVAELGPLPDGLRCVPWEEAEAEREKALLEAKAAAESTSILTARMQRTLTQTETFTAPEFATFAKAGLFDPWTVGASYVKGNRIEHGSIVYEVQQPVTAQAHQPPGSTGMLAIYRPISTGSADGSRNNPYTFITGMDVNNGKYYSYESKLYLAKADMKPCTWPPGTAGLWQWELVV